MIKPSQPPWRAGEKRHPPLVAAPPPLPKGKHVTGFSGRFAPLHPLLSPTHWILRSLVQLQFLCHPAKLGGATKGKRLYFSRVPLRGTPRSGKGCTRVNMPMTLYRCSTQRLTSPDLHILCRMCTVPLWVLSIVPHDSEGKCREVLFSPPE